MDADRLVTQVECFLVLYESGPGTVYYTLILDNLQNETKILRVFHNSVSLSLS